MRINGTLRSWNEDRGFGFITPNQGGTDVFVHISAFTRDGTSPTVGEKLSFELGKDRNGKFQAIHVVRLAFASTRAPQEVVRKNSASQTSWAGRLVVLVLLMAAGKWGFSYLSAQQHRNELAAQPAAPHIQVPLSSVTPTRFTCDGRTFCSQMTSCDEAKWFINHCTGTQMDGNHDGIPCQEQWCH